MIVLVFTGCSQDTHYQTDVGHSPAPFTTDAAQVLQQGQEIIIGNKHVYLSYDLSRGTYSIFCSSSSGDLSIRDAEAMVLSRAVLPDTRWYSSDEATSTWHVQESSNVLGQGTSLCIKRRATSNHPTLFQWFSVLDGQRYIISWLTVSNTTELPLRIGALYPLSTGLPSAGLACSGTADLRILTNGVLTYLDFIVPIYPGTMASFSNWSSLIYNQATGKSLLIGFVSFDNGQPIVVTTPIRNTRSLLSVQAGCQYDPAQILAPGESLTSETMVIDVGQASPHLALEAYADRLKTWLGIATWTQRHPDVGVPAGWNSWSGGSASGGYGTDINEAVILENMDFADRELRRWGMTYFQIDDGWQDAVGDWEVNKARFPDHGNDNGIQWLLKRAQALGFRTGLWIRAFDAQPGAHILEAHPEWFAPPIGGGLLGSEEALHLDLSQPAVQEHLAALMKRLTQWGIQWLKLDFAYRVMLTEDWYDPSLTRLAFYRNGIKLLRDTLGDNVFFLNVALVGHNMGLVDSLRLTLDTMPAWEGTSADPYDPISVIDNQGLKPMYRDAARRYYLNGRVWINHPDLIFFRSHRDPTIPPLTIDESRTFATSVVMQGGLVKLGDRLVDLSPEAVDTVRRILPVYGKTGRPLDLFTREFPEVWSLSVNDFDEPYHVLGLLNWGMNKDLSVLPPCWLADGEREITVHLADAGLDPHERYLAFESWEQTVVGEVQGTISVRIPARTARVITLRTPLGRPQLLGTNRHILGGVKVIHSLTWDPTTATLTGIQEGSVGTTFAPFTHRITLYVPDTFEARESTVVAPEGYEVQDKVLTTEGNISTLAFSIVELPGACPSNHICQHPEIVWSVRFTNTHH